MSAPTPPFSTAWLGADRGVRVLLGHADRLFRPGVAHLLDEAGLDVVDEVDAADLLERTLVLRPDVVLVDVRTPGVARRDGLQAAGEVRRRSPGTGVLVLGDRTDAASAPPLIGDRPEGVGYLLHDRIGDLAHIVEAVHQVAAGRTVLDPEVVARLLGRRVRDDPLGALSAGQLAVLAAMAEGGSNRGIAQRLHVSEAAVEKHVTAVFRTLALSSSPLEHRRVRAVLVYLGATGRL